MSESFVESVADDDFEHGFVPEHMIDRVDDKIIRELLICPLFPHILKSPAKCPVCETHFCSKCLEKSLAVNGKCPTCRSEISLNQKESEPVKILWHLLDNLKITCENSSQGCAERFLYTNTKAYTEHISESCQYVEVSCPNFRCEGKCMKKDLENHMKACESEEINCEFCKHKFGRNLLEEHIKSEACSEVCKWCTKRVLKEAEKNHSEECELMWILCLKCQKILYKKDFQIHKERHCVGRNTVLISSGMGNNFEGSYLIRRGSNEEQFVNYYHRNHNINALGGGSYLKIHQPFTNSGNQRFVMYAQNNVSNINRYGQV